MTFRDVCVYPDAFCNCADCESYMAEADLIEGEYSELTVRTERMVASDGENTGTS